MNKDLFLIERKLFAECRLEFVNFDLKDVITTSGNEGLGFETDGDDLSDLSFE